MSTDLLDKVYKLREQKERHDAEKVPTIPVTPEMATVLEACREGLRADLPSEEKEAREQLRREMNAESAIPSRHDKYSPTSWAMELISQGDAKTVRKRMDSVSYYATVHGDLSVLTGMLSDQALLLNKTFSDLLLRADRVPHAKTVAAFTGVALKTQARCVATVRELGRLTRIENRPMLERYTVEIHYLEDEELTALLPAGVEVSEESHDY